MTSRELLAIVQPFGPAVDGQELVFDRDTPTELVQQIAALQSGLRALLTKRTWFACGSAAKTAAPVAISPAARIPRWVSLLACEGDLVWDRVRPDLHLDHPELFAQPGKDL